jgi:single-strand DNA-binding protein
MPAEQSAYNSVQLIGNLGSDPEIKFLTSGSRVAECRIAVYTGKDKSGENLPPDWWTIKGWNAAADDIAEMRKGDRLQVLEGNLKQDKWNDRETGKERTKPYVLAWKVAKVERQGQTAAAAATSYDDVPF